MDAKSYLSTVTKMGKDGAADLQAYAFAVVPWASLALILALTLGNTYGLPSGLTTGVLVAWVAVQTVALSGILQALRKAREVQNGLGSQLVHLSAEIERLERMGRAPEYDERNGFLPTIR